MLDSRCYLVEIPHSCDEMLFVFQLCMVSLKIQLHKDDTEDKTLYSYKACNFLCSDNALPLPIYHVGPEEYVDSVQHFIHAQYNMSAQYKIYYTGIGSYINCVFKVKIIFDQT